MSDAASKMLAWSEFSGEVRDSLRYTANRAAANTANPAAASQPRRLTYHGDGVSGPVASSAGGPVPGSRADQPHGMGSLLAHQLAAMDLCPGELQQPFVRALAADAGLLHPAERGRRARDQAGRL